MRVAAVLIVIGGIAVFTIFDQIDKAVNYQQVPSRVVAVKEECYLKKTDRGVVSKTTSTSAMMPCAVATDLRDHHPNWQGYTLYTKIDVQFAYFSPVDGAKHSGKLQLASYPDQHKLKAGDEMPILASTSEADKVRAL